MIVIIPSPDELRERASALWYWMNERHLIYLRRRDGEDYPWTGDKILQTYRFCNVYRELDKVTKWIHTNIRVPFRDHPDLPFMLCIARTFNHPPTLQALMDKGLWPTDGEWPWDEAAMYLDDLITLGEKIYTGAYMIRAESDPGKIWYHWTKQRYITGIVLDEVWQRRQEWPKYWQLCLGETSLESASEWLQQFHGWGPFMAYEVVTDLRHTKHLSQARDIMTWANPGPGAQRGLNRILGLPVKSQLHGKAAIELMHMLMEIANGPEVRDDNGNLKNIPGYGAPLYQHMWRVEMRDIEHSLCEMDKYLRVKTGEGRPREIFRP